MILAAAFLVPGLAFSQVAPAPAAAGPAPGANGPQVGSVAPDFSLPGATRYGRLQNPVKLSDVPAIAAEPPPALGQHTEEVKESVRRRQSADA